MKAKVMVYPVTWISDEYLRVENSRFRKGQLIIVGAGPWKKTRIILPKSERDVMQGFGYSRGKWTETAE